MNDENKKEVISIIQARMSSKRLPGKVLLPLGKSTILNEVINRAKDFSKKVIIWTSKDNSDNESWVSDNSSECSDIPTTTTCSQSKKEEAYPQQQYEQTKWIKVISREKD